MVKKPRPIFCPLLTAFGPRSWSKGIRYQLLRVIPLLFVQDVGQREWLRREKQLSNAFGPRGFGSKAFRSKRALDRMHSDHSWLSDNTYVYVLCMSMR
jgi:hypothetical protein